MNRREKREVSMKEFLKGTRCEADLDSWTERYVVLS
jgi:hypothetical protein